MYMHEFTRLPASPAILTAQPSVTVDKNRKETTQPGATVYCAVVQLRRWLTRTAVALYMRHAHDAKDSKKSYTQA